MLLKSLHTFLRSEHAPNTGAPLVVAVSGGPDSVALLHGLAALRETFPYALHVAHLNHNLRGSESREDQSFVEALARSLDLPFHTRTLPAPDPALPNPEAAPSEDTLRSQRYTSLSAIREALGAEWIATGHTASDQAETLLLNLLRGSGPRGLGGMLPRGPRDVVRPLLTVHREEVLEYLKGEGIAYRRDPSNASERHTRNRIRHRVIPLLREAVSDSVVHTLSRDAALFASLDDYLRQEGTRALGRCLVKEGPGEVVLDTQALDTLHPALQAEVFRAALEHLTDQAPGLTQRHLHALGELAQATEGTKHTVLPGEVEAVREYGTMTLRMGTAAPLTAPEPAILDLGTTGQVEWGSHRLEWDACSGLETPPETHHRIVLDLSKTQGPLKIRPLRVGDRIAPKGMEGSQKVSRILVDHKVPRRMRHGVPILCDNGGPDGSDRVLWVVGQRRSRHACPRPETTRAVVLTAELRRKL